MREDAAVAREPECGFGVMLGLLRSEQAAQANQPPGGHAIIDDRRTPGGIVTPEVAATVPERTMLHRRSSRRRRAAWYSMARFLRPSKVPRESHLRSRSWTLRTA